MKKVFMRIFSLLMVAAIFFSGINVASKILSPKDGKGENDGNNSYVTTGFKAEKKNTIDVFFVGNSDIYRSFSPIEMWKSHGVTSYVSGEPLQDMEKAYKRIKQMDKTQNPSLIVLEVDGAFKNENEADKRMTLKQKINEKIESFKRQFSDIDDGLGTAIGFYFPIFKHHGRWDELTKDDFVDMKKSRYFATKGFLINKSILPYEGGMDYMKYSTEMEKMSKENKKYLYKIIKYCKDNEIELMFLEVPSASSWNYAKHNKIQKIADENKINFLDMNLKVDEIGFDWTTDTKDKGNHLNIYGAEKVTPYVSKYLVSNYKLTDQRKNHSYENWNNDAKKYAEIKEKIMSK